MRLHFIPGPIGINLGMLKDPVRYSDNVSACSLCLSCNFVCPAKVNPGSQVYLWRQNLEALGKADKIKKVMSEGMQLVYTHPSLYIGALKVAPLLNLVPESLTHFSNLNPWGIGHAAPRFAKPTFHTWWKQTHMKK